MFYKSYHTVSLCLTLVLVLFSFSPNPYEDVLLFIGKADRVAHYRYENNMGDEEWYTGQKKVLNGKEYMEKKVRSITGKETLHYYRKGRYNFYQYDERTNTEGIIVPIAPKNGETWTSADKSVQYEVISLDQRFRTPAKKYKNAIWIKATPQQNPYGIQKSKHYVHYVKGEGLVALTDTRGNFVKYLTDIDE